MIDERRHFQRLTLTEPLDGWFGDYLVRLIDVSATGALIEYDERIPADSRALLRFFWRREEVEIVAQTVRAEENRAGLKFLESSELLLGMIARCATELLQAYEANARGDRDANIATGERTIAAASQRLGTGYVTWTLGPVGWESRYSSAQDQPSVDGFTIAAGEPKEQVELLCRTYESGDAEARRLTRMLAEISVAGVGASTS